ncbi:MAG: hypothetical protein HW421_1406 [Ignavibacteria bacterium]|nr:hypothetical protein [Ignavibacteria bacterium]
MKSFYKIAFTVLMILFSADIIKADWAGYSFSQSSGSYSPITGTSSTLGTENNTDNIFSVNLGFVFYFGTQRWTSINIYTDGYISSYYTTPVTYTPISNSNLNYAISPLGRNLQGQTGSEMRYQTSGSAPNRVFTVQWSNYRSNGETGDSYNFQINLYETSNKIEFVYGNFTQGSSTLTTEVGIKYLVNTFSNRKAISGISPWSQSINGTASNDYCQLMQDFIPPSGLIYTWTPIFNDAQAGLPPLEGMTDWGDFDNDGDLDLAVCGYNDVTYSPFTAVFRNTSGSFTNINANFVNVQSGSIVWGDYDNDGDLDLAVSGQDYNGNLTTKIYNNNSGTFIDINANLPGVSYSALAWADFDNDGALDLVISGSSNTGYISQIFRNFGGTFVNINAGLSGVYYSSVAPGDYNNDGFTDLLISGYNSSGNYITQLYRNTGDGSFTLLSNTGIAAFYRGSAAWGDFDSDGDLDLLINGYGYSPYYLTYIYRNDNGVFTNINAPTTGLYYGTSSWGDYDNDGDLDALVNGYGSSGYQTYIYKNNSGTFSNIYPPILGTYYGNSGFADFDGDGDLDVSICGYSNTGYNVNSLYKNTFSQVHQNAAPSAPSSLSLNASVSGNSATLTWGNGNDSESPQTGLSYIVYAGTTQGGTDILSPHASTQNGTRRLAALGIINGSRTRILNSLPAGTIYWGVQSIDNGFVGSTFATSTFIIQTPTVILLQPTNITMTSARLNGSVNPVGTSTTFSFEYGTSNTLGSTTQPEVSSNSGTVSAYANISLLKPGTTYYYRLVATNAAGTSRSSVMSFITLNQFSESAFLNGGEYGSVEWGDFDADGDLDLLVIGNYGAYIYQNNSGTFSDYNANLPGLYQGKGVWGDYDNDGDLDALICGSYNNLPITRLYQNNSGTFTNVQLPFAGVLTGFALFIDYDNDGLKDVLVSGNLSGNTPTTKLYKNYGNNNFSEVLTNLPALSYSSGAFGDYNNDGFPDLAIIGYDNTSSQQKTYIYPNIQGNFSNPIEVFGLYNGSIEWGDYDNDGDLDLLVTGYNQNNYPYYFTKIFKNTEGSFSEVSNTISGVTYGAASWGDFNNDGLLDVIVTGSSYIEGNIVKLYKNIQNDGFDFVPEAPFHLQYYSSCKWGDFNNDGKLDVAVNGRDNNYNNQVFLYLNNNSITNSVPNTPTNLSASISGNSATLTWNTATDSQTPQNGLNYNVYIGSSTGSNNLLSPQSNLSTGYRRVPSIGCAGELNRFEINSQPSGGIYWGVQAIDNCFAGSGFSSSSFNVTSPTAKTLPASNIGMTTAQMNGIINPAGTSTTYTFEYGNSSSYTQTSTQGVVASGTSDISASFNLTQLATPGNYKYRIVASNQFGTSYATYVYFSTVGIFSELPLTLTGSQDSKNAWIDFNNDGALDGLVSGNVNTYPYYLFSFLTNTNNNFVESISSYNSNYQGSLALGDFNRDNLPDILLSGSDYNYTYSTKIFQNASGTYSQFSTSLPNIDNGWAAWGDFDNDGDQDVALAGQISGSSNITRVYRYEAGVYTDMNLGLQGLNNSHVSWIDYDKDGDLDLFVMGYDGSNCVSKLYVNNNGVFTDAMANIAGMQQGMSVWGDFDGNGFPDLLMTGYNCSTYVTNLYSNASGSFTLINSGLPGYPYSNISSGDFNNDGKPDILLTGYYNNSFTRLYTNNGSGSFTELVSDISNVYNGCSSFGDYDKDGDLDVLISGYSGNTALTKIFKNNLENNSNTNPGIPANLNTTISGTSATLSWTKPTDSQTLQDALTFNVYVGKTSGGTQIVSPLANTGSGFRKIAAYGNAEQRNFMYLNNLGEGTHYWSVQAIDNGYGFSAFAAEASFSVIDDMKPNISYQPFAGSSSTVSATITDVAINDASGINVSSFKPRCYFKRTTDANTFIDNTNQTNGWKYVESSGTISPYIFPIDFSMLSGSISICDDIQYFIVAQDLANIPNVAINSGTFTSPPTNVVLTSAQFPITGKINSFNFYTSNNLSLFYPNDNATESGRGALLFWNAASDITNYQVQLASDQNFVNLLIDQTTSNTYIPGGSLTANTNYWWRVRGYNTTCDRGQWVSRTFQTGIGLGNNTMLYGDDQGINNFPIGFRINYWGNSYNKFGASTNGWLSLLNTASSNYSNPCLPFASGNSYDGAICSFFDDLRTNQGSQNGKIYFATLGSAPNRMLVVQWNDIFFYGSGLPMGTFETVVMESTGDIKLQYRYLRDQSSSLGQRATVGIDKPGATGYVSYSCNQGLLQQGQAILFTPNNDSYIMNSSATFRWYELSGLYSIIYDNGDCASNQVIFDWTQVPGANAYKLDIATSPNDASVTQTINVGNVTTYSFNSSSTPDGTHLFARVYASLNDGGTWQVPSEFTDGMTIDITTPSTGTCSFEFIGNATLQARAVGFSDNTGITRYTYQFSTSQSFSSIEYEITTTQNQVNWQPPAGVIYFARVLASDCANNSGSFSPVSIGVGVPPLPPVLLSPSSNTGAIPLSTTLVWNQSAGANSYRLQVATDYNFSNTFANNSNISNTFYDLTGMQYNTLYYWRVNASNAVGTSEWSQVRNFTTILPVPTLTSPTFSAQCIEPATYLYWSAPTGQPVNYELQIADNDAFTNPIVNAQNVYNTSYYTYSQLANHTTYHWRVRAKNSYETGPWTNPFQFTTNVAPPFITPLGSTNICSQESLVLSAEDGYDTYQWNTGATSRTISVSTYGGYSVRGTKYGCQSQYSNSTYVSVYQPPTLWVSTSEPVCPNDPVTLTVYSAYSQTWSTGETTQSILVNPTETTSFTVIATNPGCTVTLPHTVTVRPVIVPGTVTNMLPISGTLNLSTPITFSWMPVSNVLNYDLYIWPSSQQRPSVAAISNIADVNVTYSGQLNYSTVYNWQVVAKHYCAKTDGVVQTFRTRDLPNIAPESVQIPSTVVAGQQMNVSWIVRNTGSGGTLGQQWTDAVYLSTDQILDGNDQQLTTIQNISALGPNQSYTQNQSVQIPIQTTGQYYIIVKADAWNQLRETDDSDNNAISPSTVNVTIPPLPDLTVLSVGAPTTIFTGQQANVTYRVKNRGNAPIYNGWRRDVIYMDTEEEISSTATQLASNWYYESFPINYELTRTVRVTIPISTPQGNYNIFAVTDVSNNLYESAENNNMAMTQSPMQVIPAYTPDLIITNVTASSTAWSGAPINIGWRVTNDGMGAPYENTWIDRVYLCSSSTFDANNIFLQSFAYTTNGSGITPTDYYNRTVTFNIPNGVTGRFWAFVKTDADGNVTELNNNNNMNTPSSTSFNVYLSPYPDLYVREADVSSGTYTAGESSVTVTWIDGNQGVAGAIPPWTDRVYLSMSPEWNSTYITSNNKNNVIGLAPSSTYSNRLEVGLPPNIPEGIYYSYIQTDCNNNVYEHSEESNNITRSSSTFFIKVNPPPPHPPVPDCDLESINLSSQPGIYSGAQMPISWSVRNNGPGSTATNAWYDVVYLSTDRTPDNSDYLLHNRVHSGALGNSASYTNNTTVTIPNGISGQYYIIAVTNYNGYNVWNESTLSNNSATSSVSITFTPPPDLIVENLEVPDVILSGRRANINFNIRNQGTGTTGTGWSDGIFVSTRPYFDYYANRIGTINHTSPLAAGQTLPVQATVDIPSYLNGFYYIIVYADIQNGLFEHTNETNNYSLTFTDIQTPAPSNLVVSQLLMPNTAILGDNSSLSFTVQNLGSNNAVGYIRDALYLSSDRTFDGAVDKMFGMLDHYVNLAPSQSVSFALNNIVKDYNPGNYYGIGRTNIRNTVNETTLDDNTTITTSTMEVTIRNLEIDIPTQTALNHGNLVYYRLNMPADNDLIIELTSNKAVQSGINEVFVAYGRVPTPNDYDFKHRNPADVNQKLLIPTTQSGAYYILLRTQTYFTNQTVTILARSLPFSIVGISPGVVGNGRVTTTVLGAGFRSTTQMMLRKPGTTEIWAKGTIVDFISSMELKVRWWLDTVDLGYYDLLARNPGQNDVTLNNGLKVETEIPGELGVSLIQPGSIRVGTRASYFFRYENISNVDIPIVESDIVILDNFNLASLEISSNCKLLSDLTGQIGQFIQDSSTRAMNYITRLGYKVIPVYLRNLAPGETFAVNAVFSGFNQAGRFPIEVRARGYSSDKFVIKKILEFENMRQAMLLDPPQWMIDIGLVDLALDKNRFNDSMVYAYARMGIFSHEDTTDYKYLRDYIFYVADYFFNHSEVTLSNLTTSDQQQSFSTPIRGGRGSVSTKSDKNQHPQIQGVSDVLCTIFDILNRSAGAASCVSGIIGCASSIGYAIGVSAVTLGWGAIFAGAWAGYNCYSAITGCNEFLNNEFEKYYGVNQGGGQGSGDPNYNPAGVQAGDLANFVDFKVSGQKRVDLGNGKFEMVTEEIEEIKKGGPKYTKIQTKGANPRKYVKPKLDKDIIITLATWLSNAGKAVFCDDDGNVIETPVVASRDPNDIIGPQGYGQQKFVAVNSTLPYMIRFENDPHFATAPAQRVTVRQTLNPNVDPRTFKLKDFGFNKWSFQVPTNTSAYFNVLDLPDSLGYDVEITAGLDALNNQIFWVFQTIDPETGMAPSNPNAGFLPVDDSTGKGEGFCNYTIVPKSTCQTGDVINAKATIVFDINDEIPTPEIFNTVDAQPPTSNLTIDEINIQDSTIAITVNAFDDLNGSGLREYNLFVSLDNTDFVNVGTYNSSTIHLPVFAGKSYKYFTIAKDSVNNTEAMKSVADATISMPPPPPVLVEPVNNATDVYTMPTLTWTESYGATNYHLQIAESNSFTNPVTDISTLTSAPYTPTLSPNMTYYWRVSAINEAGESNWSEVWRFSTVGGNFTIETGNISNTFLCVEHTVNVTYTVNTDFNSSNTFIAQLSDASGSFGSPVDVGRVAQAGSGFITVTIPGSTPNGNGYRIRIVSTSPIVTGTTSSSVLTIQQPLLQTGSISSSTFLRGATVLVPFIATCFNAGNQFIAQLSNSTGLFTNPYTIGSQYGTTSHTITATLPTDVPIGSHYRIRVTATNPQTVAADNGSDIAVVPPPLVVSLTNKSVCYASSVSLGTATITGGSGNYSYSWSPATGLNNATLANPTASNVVSNRTYTLTVTDNTYGTSGRASMNITVINAPSVSLPSYVMTRRSVGANLNASIISPVPSSALSGYTYNWRNQANTYTNAWRWGNAAPWVYPSTTTNYYLRVTNESGCSSNEARITVFISGPKDGSFDMGEPVVGITGEGIMFAYPNPTIDQIFVQASFANTVDVDIRLYNLLGQEILQTDKGSVDIYDDVIDLSRIPSGMYMLVIKAGNETIMKKIIKQ